MNKSQLLSFEVTNFRSVYKKQALNLKNQGEGARCVTALYGPNASGKSNIAKALVFMRWFVVNSTNASITQTPYDPFLLRDHSAEEDSTFQIEVMHENRHMRYGFSLNRDGVAHEELAEYLEGSAKARVIFKRTPNGVNATAVRYGYGKRLVESTLKGSLLLTKARENNNEYANIIFEWFALKLNVLSGEPNETAQWSLETMKRDPQIKKGVLDLIQDSDLWIRGFDIEEVDVPDDILNQLPFTDEIRGAISRTATSVKTRHAVRNSEHEIVGERVFDMDNQESTGTRQFFELAAPILYTIANGMTLYIDEFGTYLHPDM